MFWEIKRGELKLDEAKFAMRLGLGKTERVAYSYYCQILAESRSFPKTRYTEAANTLGLTEEKVSALVQLTNALGGRRSRLDEVMLTVNDLKYLIKIAEAAGSPLPMSLLLEHLSLKEKKNCDVARFGGHFLFT